MSATLTTTVHALRQEHRPCVSHTEMASSQGTCSAPFKVRQAVEGDIPVLWEHCRALAAHHGALDSFTLSPSSLSRAFERGCIKALLATDGISAFGSAIYTEIYSTWTGQANLFLEHLYVDPTFRSSGYGRALLCRLGDMAEGRVEFSVQASNVKSVKFYQAIGAQIHEGWLEMRYQKQTLPTTDETRHQHGAADQRAR